MNEQFFDDLAKGLEAGTIARGRALKLALAALLGSVFGACSGYRPKRSHSRLGVEGRGRAPPPSTSQKRGLSKCCAPGTLQTTSPTPQGSVSVFCYRRAYETQSLPVVAE